MIESKARPLRSVKQRRDKLTRLATDVKCSIQEGYNQACDVIRHIKAAGGPIAVFDSHGGQIAELNLPRVDLFFPVVFLDSLWSHCD